MQIKSDNSEPGERSKSEYGDLARGSAPLRADAPRVRDGGVEQRPSHTPGPWLQHFALNVTAIINGECEVVAMAHPLPCIGGHDDYAAQRASDQEQANARLIAAAPDLLAFAQEFIRVWAGPGATDSPLEAQARAAIAKATQP